MAILKTEAVVMKGWKLRETSMILALYTRDYGKIKVVAKGARDPKSKFKGCLEPLTCLNVVFYDKKNRDLQLLSQADLVDPHVHIIGDVIKTTLALSVAELVHRVIEGEEANPELFDLMTGVIAAIDKGTGFLEGYLWYFEEHLMEISGYKAVWHDCLECHTSLGEKGGLFQAAKGGLFCHRCGREKGGLQVSSETLEILFWLQQSHLDHVGELNPGTSHIAEIRKLFDLYFRTHLDHIGSLKALNMFYELGNA